MAISNNAPPLLAPFRPYNVNFLEALYNYVPLRLSDLCAINLPLYVYRDRLYSVTIPSRTLGEAVTQYYFPSVNTHPFELYGAGDPLYRSPNDFDQYINLKISTTSYVGIHAMETSIGRGGMPRERIHDYGNMYMRAYALTDYARYLKVDI